MNMNQLYGEWVAKLEGEQRAYFVCYLKSKVGLLSTTVEVRTDSDSADSIEEIIKTLPIQNEDVETLSRYVRDDSLRGFGTDYPEYGIVAYVGTSIADKPFARVKMVDGSFKFVPHPYIDRMVKRYR